jgi:hypothetical protein
MNDERFLNNPEYADKKIAQLTQKLAKKRLYDEIYSRNLEESKVQEEARVLERERLIERILVEREERILAEREERILAEREKRILKEERCKATEKRSKNELNSQSFNNNQQQMVIMKIQSSQSIETPKNTNSVGYARMEAIKERDMAFKKRDLAIKERDFAIKERDLAIKERDLAISERDQLQVSKNIKPKVSVSEILRLEEALEDRDDVIIQNKLKIKELVLLVKKQNEEMKINKGMSTFLYRFCFKIFES